MILQDKVALVTGGTSGIGRTTAIAYAQQQAKVVVVGRRIDEGEETVRLIQEAGGEAIFVQLCQSGYSHQCCCTRGNQNRYV
ncbi:hypothetical protein WA1_03060 [Scytonema hofmannii PCC 7110]|jgi:NAD(P)-dependent dehydrogenase (short-subunit alcohol dehydrogenase family)|uniref:Short-chain dehydrogenase n=1 Tax=Scytonema hofmannii PCC 7110 TaxID=128403 RepID=A0A139XHF4_9CYAN|nr:hypothetical protein WA1_03060 [Scytonema hofmannii PCC 7110]